MTTLLDFQRSLNIHRYDSPSHPLKYNIGFKAQLTLIIR